MINRSYLREASNRWEGSTVDGVTDISPQDAKIIDMLTDYFADKEEFEIAQLLSQWKKAKDDKFYKMVLEFTDYDNLDVPEDEKKNPLSELLEDFSPTLITINDMSFSVSLISLVGKGFRWSEAKGASVFTLEINSREVIYKNIEIIQEYRTEKQRDIQFDKLKGKLMSHGIKFI